MYPKSNGQGNGPLRTSDRLRRRPKMYGRAYVYYSPAIIRHPRKSKTKTRTAASRIARMLGTRLANTKDSVATTLRRSTRTRRSSINPDDYTDSSGPDDEDLMSQRPSYHHLRNRIDNNVSQDDFPSSKRKKVVETKETPRREGLRPRRQKGARTRLDMESCDDKEFLDGTAGPDEIENGNEIDENDVDDGLNEHDSEAEEEEEEDEGEEENDEEDLEEEQEGRRRYDLRNRADVRRLSMEEGKKRPRSPRRVLQRGIGTKISSVVRKVGSRVHKRHRLSGFEDSDDSLLVDELDQGPVFPWGRGGSRQGPPWLFGGLDMHGTTAWGLNAAASGWGHQGDSLGSLSSGVQTAGPSSKGGADIQPLQVDESISFDEIGGLSEYINALKEMVFFPLLYPDFFASYHITPPRGVLLCGPPGTGKTLIARALACAASKAGQKVSFYMRKGADVLSKWVGEAERQLKLLFEEAQRNQPSIIFFDEIDGLAPVRSSKQEQIHNSIVSTLLALMDGLDSRGQVVLIGATNRIDAIDGALRRPGRFDREFNFPLPGNEARAEILDIHTRKWKQPPSDELKLELAVSCVGYCGADLKALCTEAAIHAFREKYPQVYTSDDKFLIDVDSVKVEKYHFVEAMSTITPAAHRGSVVHARPLSVVVSPCLQRQLQVAMDYVADIFPLVSSQLAKVSMLSYGSAVPLVYRPRLLLCGGEGCGLDHLGPAILHRLEKFPVHSLGLPSLLSDPSAKSPEEALVHIFGEARRTTPSVLYISQFNLWWDNADEQLRAVLRTLLDELPSDLPILLLGTSLVPLAEIEGLPSSVFPLRTVCQVDDPSKEDISLFFERLIEAALSVSLEIEAKPSQGRQSPTKLHMAPKVPSGPKPSELKAKIEAEQHALRRMRMCLRDVCNRVFYDKRFSAFHYPVTDEDAPNYRSIIQNPMDVATLLQRVDSGQYITCNPFLQDLDFIVTNAKVYNGNDHNGTRIISRAHELRDAVHGMLSQMDPALVTYCDKIAAQGGPSQMPDDIEGSIFPLNPVVQLGANTRTSARLRNEQPGVNVDQSYEALKRPKKSVDAMNSVEDDDDTQCQESTGAEQAQEVDTNDKSLERTESPPAEDGTLQQTVKEASAPAEDTLMSDGEMSSQVESIKKLFLKRTKKICIPQLERLYTCVLKGVFVGVQSNNSKHSILEFLMKFAENKANFSF